MGTLNYTLTSEDELALKESRESGREVEKGRGLGRGTGCAGVGRKARRKVGKGERTGLYVTNNERDLTVC